MSDYKLTYKQLGERSVLIEWPAKIDKIVLRDVLMFKNMIQKFYIKEKVYINTAYSSLIISYIYDIENIYDVFSMLKSLYLTRESKNKSVFKSWKIPVCYDDDFAIDLEDISAHKKLSKSEIIKLHFETTYTVFFIGFLPGFLYLGGLDKQLHFPRKSSPRLHIKKGAVGIGGEQTGIYPNASPGGWNIIGNSPINFFDVTKKEPCFAKPGDEIQFFKVSLEEYQEIKIDVEKGDYKIQNTIIND